MSNNKILVTGASGKLGQAVVTALLEDFQLEPSQLIVTTRNPFRLQSLIDLGVEVRVANFAEPDSLANAFHGANQLLLISIDASGPRTQAHLNAVAAAQQAGVEHIVYTSMPAPLESPVVFAHEHQATEQAILDSRIEHATILRNNWYFENLAEYFASTLQSGFWINSAGDGRTAQLSRKDLAFAAASALIKGGDGRVTLQLNGPDEFTHAEMARLIDKVIGTSIQMVDLNDEQYQAKLEAFDLPTPIVDLCVTMDMHNRGNYSAGSSKAFETLTGRKPMRFVDWLELNKQQLVALAQGQ